MIVPAIIAPQLLEQSTQSIASPAGEKSMDAIEQNSREFCREINIAMDTFTRLVGSFAKGCGNVAQPLYGR